MEPAQRGGNNGENGFKDFMYDSIVPACFLAPMKSTFDMEDAQTFLEYTQALQHADMKTFKSYSKVVLFWAPCVMPIRNHREPVMRLNYYFGTSGKKTGNEVAIKATNHLGMMRPLDVRKREFEVLNRLDHKNIVKIFASENELRSQNEIIVMELCTGGSLYTLLEHPANAYGFSEKDCKDIIRDVVAGMEHLREQGIVHRDLKPGNIMRAFNQDGTCNYKLTDFGAARELEHSAEQFVSVYGTEEYLHPDLYERGVLRKSSGKTFGANVDLWSIGVTFYHIATGKLPFRPHGGRQNKDTMYHITTAKKSGMISGIQRSGGGDIEWSDKLPDHTQLSRGFQDLLAPILAGVLESDHSKIISFGEFFGRIQDMMTRKVGYTSVCLSIHPFLSVCLSIHLYMYAPYLSLCLSPSLDYCLSVCPATSSVTKLPDEWTLEADTAAAKIMANCAYSCKISTQYYTDVINAMCLSIDAVIKSFKTELLETAVDCGKVESIRITASHMTKVCCN
ncbi:hypothetical protein QZH41_020326, partial [Actinostola sp. cb2023]